MGRSRVVRIADEEIGRSEGGEPRCGRLGFVARAKTQWLGEGVGDADGVGFASAGETVEDPITAGGGALWVAERVETGRCLGKAGEQRALSQREVGQGFLKIEAGSLGGADAQISVIEAVEVGSEDLWFGPLRLKLPSGEGFADLGERISFCGCRGNLDELLGDGGGTGDNPPIEEKIASGPASGEVIDSAVVVEPFILSGERAVDQVGRELIRRDGRGTRRIRKREVGDRRAVAVHDHGRGLRVLQQTRGQGCAERCDPPADADDDGGGQRRPDEMADMCQVRFQDGSKCHNPCGNEARKSANSRGSGESGLIRNPPAGPNRDFSKL